MRTPIIVALIAGSMAVLPACTPQFFKAPLTFETPRVDYVSRKVPLKAAILVPESTGQYVLRVPVPMGGWDYHLGEKVGSLTYDTFSQIFSEAVVLARRSPDSTYDVLVEPEIDPAQTKGSISFSSVSVTVGMNYRLSDRDGLVWKGSFTGSKTTAGKTSEMPKQGAALTEAVDKAARAVHGEFSRPEMIARIAAKRGPAAVRAAQSSAMPAAGAAPAPSAAPRSDVDELVPRTKRRNNDAIAVVIGNRDYRNTDIPAVDFAINDAESVRNYLVHVLGYREGNIIVKLNASKGDFESVFGTRDDHRGKLFNYLKEGKSDIFVYYSGHGAPDLQNRQGYFVPTDADPQMIGLSGYSLKLFYENLAKVSRDMRVRSVFVVIDSCFSGVSEKGLLIKNASPITIEVADPVLGMKNAVVLTSSSNTEVSSWYPETGHGMFTYFFLKALQQTAEDGRPVSAKEVFNAVSDKTEGVPYYARRLHGRVQTPQLRGDGGRLIAGP